MDAVLRPCFGPVSLWQPCSPRWTFPRERRGRAGLERVAGRRHLDRCELFDDPGRRNAERGRQAHAGQGRYLPRAAWLAHQSPAERKRRSRGRLDRRGRGPARPRNRGQAGRL